MKPVVTTRFFLSSAPFRPVGRRRQLLILPVCLSMAFVSSPVVALPGQFETEPVVMCRGLLEPDVRSILALAGYDDKRHAYYVFSPTQPVDSSDLLGFWNGLTTYSAVCSTIEQICQQARHNGASCTVV